MKEQVLHDILRGIASLLEIPVVVILLLLIVVTVIMTGILIGELFMERLHMERALPQLINAMQREEKPVEQLLQESGLLKRQKKALLCICGQKELTPLKREALAGEIMDAERAHYDLRIRITDLVMKLGPMFGLLGTLIPLGPGIIALGRGDTFTLSASLLTAFDTTIAGLIAAAAATVLSAIRKRWYARDMGQLDVVMESLLEVMDVEEK